MKNFQQNLQKLEAADTQVLGVSMDSAFANKAFADSIGVTFPLLSDWGGKVTREPGPVKGGTSVIAFVEDPDGYKIEFIESRA